MEPTQTPLLRRLNGRPQACDLCRARKVACDHGQPKCNRCRKRKQECVYTTDPKPMGKRTRRHTTSPNPITQISPPAASGTGYLGFTSHSTVFEEARNNLSLLHGPDIGPPQSGPGRGRVRACLSEMPPLRQMCLYVLGNMPTPEKMVPPRISPCHPDQWTHIAVNQIVRSLNSNYSEYFTSGEDGLEELARIISDNTIKPLQNNPLDGYGWMDQFAGSNLRWESLGLLWTFWELGDGPMGPHPPKQCVPSPVVRACLSHCIDLSRHFSQGNDLLLYICYRRATMESIVEGDASLACSNAHAQTISLLTFLGIHAETDTAPYKPSLCSENKRRMFAAIFNIDKIMVTFTGRPPLISRRYSSTPLPLDIQDKDLLGDEAAIQRAVNALDERGWDIKGGVYRATLVRARCMIAFIRDEILEIALSPRVNTTIDGLLELKARQINTVAQFPRKITYQPPNLADDDVDVDILFAKMLVRLEHLQNIFFVERLLLRYGLLDEGDLLVTSYEMVTMTLTFWTHQDLFSGHRLHFAWLLMQYAAPGGGILCLELLRPTFQGIHPKNPKLTRSSIIQQLSLLVGFLDWVHPSASNGELCADCKAIIQVVLDHNLNTAVNGDSALETLDWGSMQVDFNFDLLDTFDWIRDS